MYSKSLQTSQLTADQLRSLAWKLSPYSNLAIAFYPQYITLSTRYIDVLEAIIQQCEEAILEAAEK